MFKKKTGSVYDLRNNLKWAIKSLAESEHGTLVLKFEEVEV